MAACRTEALTHVFAATGLVRVTTSLQHTVAGVPLVGLLALRWTRGTTVRRLSPTISNPWGCSPTCSRLQPDVVEAATPSVRACNHMHRRRVLLGSEDKATFSAVRLYAHVHVHVHVHVPSRRYDCCCCPAIVNLL